MIKLPICAGKDYRIYCVIDGNYSIDSMISSFFEWASPNAATFACCHFLKSNVCAFGNSISSFLNLGTSGFILFLVVELFFAIIHHNEWHDMEFVLFSLSLSLSLSMHLSKK